MIRARGFTLVELVSVMAIIGILAAVAGPRFFDTDAFAAEGFFNDTRASLRYARTLAVGSGCSIYFRLNSAGYRVARWRGADCNDRSGVLTPVQRPAGGAFEATVPDRVSIGSAELFFDPIGRPRRVADGALLTVTTNVAVGSKLIRVEAESGLVN